MEEEYFCSQSAPAGGLFFPRGDESCHIRAQVALEMMMAASHAVHMTRITCVGDGEHGILHGSDGFGK